jgi:hypothetical protein
VRFQSAPSTNHRVRFQSAPSTNHRVRFQSAPSSNHLLNAETFAISSERDYMNSRIQIGAFYASSQFEGQIRRNTITSIGPVQRDPSNTTGHFVSHRAEIFHGQTIHVRQERDDGMPAGYHGSKSERRNNLS